MTLHLHEVAGVQGRERRGARCFEAEPLQLAAAGGGDGLDHADHQVVAADEVVRRERAGGRQQHGVENLFVAAGGLRQTVMATLDGLGQARQVRCSTASSMASGRSVGWAQGPSAALPATGRRILRRKAARVGHSARALPDGACPSPRNPPART